MASLLFLLHYTPLVPHLPRPLKVPAATHHRNTLIHNRLADPEVAVDPLADTRRLSEAV
jgi:hypothetical protein